MYPKKTTEQYVKEAREVHGDMYDYSKLVYVRSSEKVEIVCKKHGSFWVRPAAHLCGSGCPKCCNRRPLWRRGLRIDRTPNESGKRVCSTCKRELDISSFAKSPSVHTKDGYVSQCRKCLRKTERVKENKNRERNNRLSRERERAKKIQYELDHPEEMEQKRLAREEKKRNKRNRDRVAGNMRWRIRDALKKGTPRPHLIELVGCTLEFLRQYIESMFHDGMSWDNYGRKGWHIDHIRPVASFDMTNMNDVLECFNYTNLQPLWFRDNIVKGSLYNGRKYISKKI